MEKINGRILKSIGGLYHVETPCGMFICKARGVFRLQEISPAVGDMVEVVIEENAEPLIAEISPRKNHLVRPPLANLDAVVLVVSSVDPVPNALVLDKLIAILELKGIEPVLVFTKIDRKLRQEFFDVYKNAGFKIHLVDNTSGEGVEMLREYLQGKTSALIGNSGVGKSSLMNILLPELNLVTAITSKKLGRGKHTTRHVQLYNYGEGGYIADTPGFSTVEASKYADFESNEVWCCFREFSPYVANCKYQDCRHTGESECGIKAAVESGEIAKSRYQSYLTIYDNIKKEENTFN